ncbi:hypothetical protein KAX01_01315 [Candidatus Bathyarchaeota archaeon]|nr:hypothetical protein [Candidatus Bathyarchaeota archaeon]
MNTFSPKYSYFIHPEKGIQVKLKEGDLERFNIDLLRIGDLNVPSKPIEVLSVMFDLEGFTTFTRQVDPHLSIPNFVSDFFNWLFSKIKEELIDKKQENVLWAELPFFSKFMGDGALFLWKIDLDAIIEIDEKSGSEELQFRLQEFVCNIVATMLDIVRDYTNFFDTMQTKYVDIPPNLRCGIARGQVFPIGNGRDFVGPCINISNRLQKFNGLSFAFSARGIDKEAFSSGYKKQFVKKRVSIRGIGSNELIYVFKEEFKALPKDIRKTMLTA